MEDLRKISFEFRRVSSDMLNSITDDNNVYLIKFREFIDDNKIIKDYIDSKIKYSNIDWKKSFIEEDCGYKSVIIPQNKNDHIKAMYDYLVVMTDTILFKSSILTFDSLYKRLFNRRNDIFTRKLKGGDLSWD